MKVLLVILALSICIGIMLSAPGVGLLALTLLTGWFPAARRLLSGAPFTAPDMAIFGASCALFVFGVHWFVRSLRPWSFRRTMALTGTLAFVLLSIMSLVGVAHQTGWVLLSHEPLFTQRGGRLRERMDLERTAKGLANIVRTNGVAASAAIADPRMPDTSDRKRPWEKYHLLALDHTNDRFAIIWHRDERIYGRVGSVTVTLDGEVTIQSVNYLTNVTGKAHSHAATSY